MTRNPLTEADLLLAAARSDDPVLESLRLAQAKLLLDGAEESIRRSRILLKAREQELLRVANHQTLEAAE